MWIAAFRAIIMDDELLDMLVFHPFQESVHGVFGLRVGVKPACIDVTHDDTPLGVP